MTGLLLLFSALTFDRVPDGWILARRVAEAGTVAHLPVSLLVSAARRLWLCYHDDPDAPVVRLLPGSRRLTLPDDPLRQTAGRCDSAGRKRPGIDLYRPYYAPEAETGDGGRRIQDLPVDTASALYTALIHAGLDQLLLIPGRGVAGSSGSDALAARAEATMVDVPPAQRQAVFLEASVDFLAHALTVAHEIARHQRRRRARGSTLCGLFAHRDSLFGSWTTVFGNGRYGAMFHDGTSWTSSKSALSVDDRRWLARTALAVAWTGDAQTDFAWLCDP